MTASPNPAVVGQTTMFTATVRVVSPGLGNPTGGVTFFDGLTALGTATLTAAGQAALPYAKAALAAIADIRVAVDELTQLVRGTIRIGTVTSHSVDIPSLLADFHAEHPQVEITLSTDSSDVLIEKVRTGRLDAAIVSVAANNLHAYRQSFRRCARRHRHCRTARRADPVRRFHPRTVVVHLDALNFMRPVNFRIKRRHLVDSADARSIGSGGRVFANGVCVIAPQGMGVHHILGRELAVAVVELHALLQLDAP